MTSTSDIKAPVSLNDITISGYQPGDIGAISELHGTYYHEHWGLGVVFEAKVAVGLADLMMRFNSSRDMLWVARHEGRFVGSIAIDGLDADTQGARLRWFIIAPEYHGIGLGKHLVGETLDFCRQAGFKRVYLTTFAGLDTARHLYEKVGFRLCEEQEDNHWGKVLTEKGFELML